MTNIITKKVLLLAATLLFAPATQAQEFIKEVKNHNDNYSVIRQYRENLWIISDFNLGKSVFSMVSETGITTQQLVLGYIEGTDSTIIRDFKIYKDTVYFCGQTWYGETPQAVWGYFPLAGFPSVPVYFNVRKYNSFDKLEVFSIDLTGAEIHVVMIGMSSGKEGVVIDEIRTSANTFDEYSSQTTSQEHRMCDLIQTDNYIMMTDVVSFMNTIPGGNVTFMLKPTTLGTTIFSSVNYNYFHIAPQMISHRIEHCSLDAAAIVVQTPTNDLKVVGLTSPLNYYATISFAGELPLSRVFDLTYNTDSKVLDILMKVYGGGSKIYHVQSGMAYAGGTIPFGNYDSENINSIEYLPASTDWIVASGNSIENQTLRFYRYHDYAIPNCAKHGNVECNVTEIEWNPREQEMEYDRCQVELIRLNAYPYETPIITICE